MVSSFYFISGQIFVLPWGGKQGGRREGGWGAEEGLMRKWLQGSTGQGLKAQQGSGEGLERGNRHISCQGCLKLERYRSEL